ncbi:MAG: GTPase ObgE [Erysipelotrichaceae bacterium]|nr:GTPase ObgE [Erysipelotrichaceae bacterium]
MFIDSVKIKVNAGNGGNGLVAFRREKYVPFGGPSGGDGGKGGSIIFEVDTNKSTLLDLRYNRTISAKNGGVGKNKKMSGADGDDIIIKVPQGTTVKDLSTNQVIADLIEVGQREVIARGGRGGKGNWHFATSRDSAPEFAQPGESGESKEIQLELKLLADVGLIGFPSVGKSTLLSVVSAAKPEIADYHFTTLVPNLGVVKVKDGRSFVMADLPGLIKGASQGKGLGHEFLKHIERCRVLIHVIDIGAIDGRDPIEDFKIINEELIQYEYRLSERPQIVFANKIDLEGAQENLDRFKKEFPNIKVFEGSAIINEGIDKLLYETINILSVTPLFPLYDSKKEDKHIVYTYKPKEKEIEVKNLGNGQWELISDKASRIFKSINFDNEEGYYRFAVAMKKLGVDDALREAGVLEGDLIILDDYRFEFVE